MTEIIKIILSKIQTQFPNILFNAHLLTSLTLIYQAYLVNVLYQAGVLEGPHVFFIISQLQITQIMVFGFLKL
jgi:hypothetical protein